MDPAPPPATDVEEEENPGGFSGLEPQRQRMLVVLGVVLVVGILGGFVAGFLVEQNLGDTHVAKAKVKANTPHAAPRLVSLAGGVVTEQTTDSISIATPNGLPVKLTLLANFGVKRAVKASRADIAVGANILQSGNEVSKGNFDAAEIIVLPGTGSFGGWKVTAVQGDKVSALQGKATRLTVTVKSTTAVYKLGAASKTQIDTGSRVLAIGLGVSGSAAFHANEIVILAPESAFAKG